MEKNETLCAGLLHAVKDLPHGIVEETARQCIQMNSCRYKSFKQVLGRIQAEGVHQTGTLAAMPAAATTSMLSSKYDCAPDFGTKMFILSTLCSIPTIFLWGLILKSAG